MITFGGSRCAAPQSGDADMDLDEEREQVGAIQARVETAEVIAVCWNTIILITF